MAHEARGQAARRDDPQLLHVPRDPAPRATEGVGRPEHDWVTETRRHGFGLLHAEAGLAERHGDLQGVHRLLERDPVLPSLDGVRLDADGPHTVLVEDSGPVEL